MKYYVELDKVYDENNDMLFRTGIRSPEALSILRKFVDDMNRLSENGEPVNTPIAKAERSPFTAMAVALAVSIALVWIIKGLIK